MLAKCEVKMKAAWKKLSSVQNQAIRIINFKQQDFPINELYYANGILKIKDYIHLINFLFVRDVLSNESLEVFSNYFTKSDDFHDHMTRHSSRHSVIMEHSNTVLWFLLHQEQGSFLMEFSTKQTKHRCHLWIT